MEGAGRGVQVVGSWVERESRLERLVCVRGRQSVANTFSQSLSLSRSERLHACGQMMAQQKRRRETGADTKVMNMGTDKGTDTDTDTCRIARKQAQRKHRCLG